MPAPEDALDNKPVETPGVVPVLPPPDFGGPNKLMTEYRAEADAKMAADEARPRDEQGRFLPTTPAETLPEPAETSVVEEVPPAEPPVSKVSFDVAMAARQAGLPQEWIDKAPSDDFVILALQGLHARLEASRQPPLARPAPSPLVAKLELALSDETIAPELIAPLKKIIDHVNAMGDAYGARLEQVNEKYGALEGAYGQLRASTARYQERQEASVLDRWVAEHPKLAAVLGNASEALGQLDENGFPTTDTAFQWRKLCQTVIKTLPNLRLDTPAGRAQLTKAAKQLWPDAFQGVPDRNGKGSLPLGASIRPAAKGGESQPRNAEEAELQRLQEAFAEVGARDARDWYVKTGGKPLPV